MNKWTSKGESIFFRLPRIGAVLYDKLMHNSPMQLYYKEIAEDLTSRLSAGRLLDVGTGPGRLLQAIHGLNPAIELYGLDISAAMLKQARKNLYGIAVNLRQGNIRHTDFPNDYFDLVACTGSLYLWERPEEGLQEIYRILKSGQSAILFECDRESDRQALQIPLRENLRQVNMLSKIFGPLAIKQALDAAYSRKEISEIIQRTSFAPHFSVAEVTISGLPMWFRIELLKG
jgi:ubiquinone/menaquinone biosynthesis C-methylase UbiE